MRRLVIPADARPALGGKTEFRQHLEVALPLQRRYIGEPFDFFTTHIGRLGRAVHIWRCESLADREARRDAMEADPEWQAYLRLAREEDTLLDLEDQILRPVSFFDGGASAADAGGGR